MHHIGGEPSHDELTQASPIYKSHCALTLHSAVLQSLVSRQRTRLLSSDTPAIANHYLRQHIPRLDDQLGLGRVARQHRFKRLLRTQLDKPVSCVSTLCR